MKSKISSAVPAQEDTAKRKKEKAATKQAKPSRKKEPRDGTSHTSTDQAPILSKYITGKTAAQRAQLEMIRQAFNRFDLNKDGKITKADILMGRGVIKKKKKKKTSKKKKNTKRRV